MQEKARSANPVSPQEGNTISQNKRFAFGRITLAVSVLLVASLKANMATSKPVLLGDIELTPTPTTPPSAAPTQPGGVTLTPTPQPTATQPVPVPTGAVPTASAPTPPVPSASPGAPATVVPPAPPPPAPLPNGVYQILNEKGPGKPIMIATQPWPAKALGPVTVAPKPGDATQRQAKTLTDAPTANQESALSQLQKEAKRFREGAKGYSTVLGQIIRQRYELKRKLRLAPMKENFDRDTAELKEVRAKTIERLKAFLAKYPEVPEHSPNAMFRLAALYEDLAQDTEIDGSDPQSQAKTRALNEPAERLYRDIINKFPNYTQRASVQFFLASLLADSGRAAESQWVYRSLVCANHYSYPLPPPATPQEAKQRESWKDGFPPIAQDRSQKYWEQWYERHHNGEESKKTAKPIRKPKYLSLSFRKI